MLDLVAITKLIGGGVAALPVVTPLLHKPPNNM